MASTSDFEIPVRHGSLSARLHVPSQTQNAIIVYVHGGGWALGEIEDYDALGRQIAFLSGCDVLLPTYRLAPEYPFPAALEDVEDVLKWAWAEACSAKRGLIVAGDSAGANLATVVCRKLRGKISPHLQVLIYPVTDCDFSTPSYLAFGKGLSLTADDMSCFFNYYVAFNERTHPDVSPLRASELAGMPATLVVTAEFDVLRDEGESYASKLCEAGVPVKVWRYKGLIHGFVLLHNRSSICNQAVQDICSTIKEALGLNVAR